MVRALCTHKEPSKVGSQRTITEFAVKRNKPVPEAASEDVEVSFLLTSLILSLLSKTNPE